MPQPTLQRELAGGKLLIDEPSAGVARLTISNPEKRNALDRPILDGISSTLADLAHEDSGAHCMIVTGAQRMFSAGYDIGEIHDRQAAERAEQLVAHPFTEAIDALEAFPYPTLAALPGHTIGGGLELALACDLRVAAADIRLGMPPAKLGLVYSHTGLRRFIDAIGTTRTRELFLLGRYIDAPTALSWGLVNRVVASEDVEAVTLDLAGEMAGHAPLSQRGNKRIVNALLRAEGELSPAVERELIELRLESFASQDLHEGMRAFVERRAPRWRGE
jgi:enoyl-CoA hydratase/carnithine racemase